MSIAPIWKTLFISDAHVYALGKLNKTYLIASYSRESIPDNLYNSVMYGTFSHYNRYDRDTDTKRLSMLSNLRMKYPVIRSKDTFECPICLEDSILYSPISCIHKICSMCLSDILFKTSSCPLCRDPISQFKKLKNKLFNGIPLSHVVRTMQTINLSNDEEIKYVCNILST